MAKRARKKAEPKAGATKATFTAKDIVLRSPDELIPFPNNPKLHTTEQIDAIAANIQAFGFDQPVLVDEDSTVLKGHGRRLAARKLGVMVPTIVRKGLSVEDKWAIVISDNAIPAMTGFDKGLLKIGLTTLAKVDYDLKLTGFDHVRLATFIGGTPGATNPDDTPELVAKSISRAGDIWQMGEHRLICGDCSDKDVMAKVIGKAAPKLMLTDPPYKYSGENGGNFYNRGNYKKILNADRLSDFEVSKLPELLETNVIFTSKELLADYLDVAREKKIKWDIPVLHRSAAIPNHSNHLTTDLDYIVLMGKVAPKNGLEHSDYSKLFSMSSWDRPVPWAKPVELMARLMRLFSDAGECILEPYCGSGTTIIAAEQLGRACIAIEVAPLYVDLAIRRWEKFSSKKAVLIGTKKTFDQVEKERAKIAA